jgi:HSP20 family protein
MPRKKNTEDMGFRDSIVEEVKTQLRGGLRKVTNGEVILSPQVDIREEEEAFQMRFLVPGLDPTALKVVVQQDELVIEEAKSDEEPKEKPAGTVILEEIEKGRYYRKFRLTDDIDHDGVSASLSNGILSVTLQKGEPVEKKAPKKKK